MEAACTAPRYPQPTTEMCMRTSSLIGWTGRFRVDHGSTSRPAETAFGVAAFPMLTSQFAAALIAADHGGRQSEQAFSARFSHAGYGDRRGPPLGRSHDLGAD